MKNCEICLRPTILYIHSTTANFTKVTGRKTTIYGKYSYVICDECLDIIKKIRQQHIEDWRKRDNEAFEKFGLVAPYIEYIPTDGDIGEYKRRRQYIKNMAFLPGPYEISY